MLTTVLPCFQYLRIESVSHTADAITIVAVTKRSTARCPLCARRSRRVHSQYRRTVADLPLAGTPVVLHIRARKFFCSTPTCPRRIFTERLPEFVAPHARRSQGLRLALRHIAVGLPRSW